MKRFASDRLRILFIDCALILSVFCAISPVRFASAAPDGPQIFVSPSSHDFGDVPVGSGPRSVVLTISNAGDTGLDITMMQLPADGFSLDVLSTANACGSTAPSISPGAGCSIEVLFSPEAVGSYGGAFNLFSNDPLNYYYTVPLLGNGVTGGTSTFTVTTQVAPAGAGSVVLNPDQPSYDQGAQVKLKAVPRPKFKFEHWGLEDGYTDDENPVYIDIYYNRQVTAFFAPLDVWVDDDFSQLSCGGRTWGVDCFDNIHAGVDAVAEGGTVHVLPGNYSSMGGFVSDSIGVNGLGGKEPDLPLFIGKNMTIRGQGRTRPVLEGDPESYWSYGFYISSGLDGVIIENFEVRGFWVGIYAYGSSPTIRDNELHHNASAAVLLTTDQSSAPEPHATVERNIIHDEEVGIRAHIDTGAAASHFIVNNLIASVKVGVEMSGSSDSGNTSRIYHNTMDGRTADSLRGISLENGAPEIKYNIITNFDEVGITSANGSATLDYNNVWNNWENYSGVSPGPHDIAADPLHGADLLQLDSPCIDAIPFGMGDPVSEDRDGNARPSGKGFDMGALESQWGAAGSVIYVDRRASDDGEVRDGTSWGRAYRELQSALAAAKDWQQIWVARGVYLPGTAPTDTFQLNPRIAVYGGFAGTETSRSQRDLKRNATFLSGDVKGDDRANFLNREDNILHIVTGSGMAILDGFHIIHGGSPGAINSWRAGDSGASAKSVGGAILDGGMGAGLLNPDGSSPTVANCVFTANGALEGGAMYNGRASFPLVRNCVFVGNMALHGGGAIFNAEYSQVGISNSVFDSNSTQTPDRGGAIANYGPGYSTTIENCTFSNNFIGSGNGAGSALYSGHGPMPLRGSSVYVENSIFWSNPAETSSILNEAQQVYSTDPTVILNIRHSDVEGTVAGIENRNGAVTVDKGGNIAQDPLFLNESSHASRDGAIFTHDDGLRLRGGSPCADMGRTNAASGSSPHAPGRDILGIARPVGAAVDMGAYEGEVFLQANPPSLDFGKVEVGDSSSLLVSLSNTSTSDLIIRGMTLSGAAPSGVFALDPRLGPVPCGSSTPTIPAGGSCTAAVTFSPPVNGAFNALLSIDSEDFLIPFASIDMAGRGALRMGSMTVTIAPPDAVAAGAAWSIDGGSSWNESGATLTAVRAGAHTLIFKALPDWTTPTDRTVTVIGGQTATATGRYVRQTGSLQVIIRPAAAVEGGARWKVDDGEWRDSGDVASDLAIGEHTVAFGEVDGWISPKEKHVIIAVRDLKVLNILYTEAQGSVTLDLPGTSQSDAPKNAYRLIGIPVIPDDPDTFTTLKDHFGGSKDPTAWRLYKLVNGQKKPITQAGQDAIQPGKGWWIVSTEGKSITIQGAPMAGNFRKRISKGYQLIACPFHDRKVPWANVLADKANAGLGLGPVILGWDGSGEYVSASFMEPGKAYLAWVGAGGALSMKRAYPQGASAEKATVASVDARQPAPPLPPGASIKLLSPRAEQNLKGGDLFTIRWSSEGITPNGFDGGVELAYSTDGGKTFETMASGVENNGSYDWPVPRKASNRCLIRITSKFYPDLSEVSSGTFSIE
jgi:hypothetical protein